MHPDDMLALLDDPRLPQVLADHPALARDLRALQQSLHDLVLAGSRQYAEQMRPGVPAPAVDIRQLDSVLKLKAIAAQREAAARTTIDTARQMVFGAIANAGNTQWNPGDAGTYQPLDRSLLLKIMQLDAG